MTPVPAGIGGVRSAHTQGCCLVRPTSRTEELTLFLSLSVELSFQVSHGRGWGKSNSRGNATKLWSSQRSHSPSSQLDPAPREVRAASTTSTATPPCSLGGSGLAGRRQTKPTQLSSQPGILEDPAVPGITQDLIITGHRLLSACTPALCCDPGEVWLLHLKIHISANPTMELNLPG